METTIILMLLFILTIWIVPIPLGIKKAKQKGFSPHWMWFGIFPLYGLLVFLILCFVPQMKKCANCGEKTNYMLKLARDVIMRLKNRQLLNINQKQKNIELLKLLR